jgi:hypothetical protein
MEKTGPDVIPLRENGITFVVRMRYLELVVS